MVLHEVLSALFDRYGHTERGGFRPESVMRFVERFSPCHYWQTLRRSCPSSAYQPRLTQGLCLRALRGETPSARSTGTGHPGLFHAGCVISPLGQTSSYQPLDRFCRLPGISIRFQLSGEVGQDISDGRPVIAQTPNSARGQTRLPSLGLCLLTQSIPRSVRASR